MRFHSFDREDDGIVIPILMICCHVRNIKLCTLIKEYRENDEVKKIISDLLKDIVVDTDYLDSIKGRSTISDWYNIKKLKESIMNNALCKSIKCTERNLFYSKEILKADKAYKDNLINMSMYEIENRLSDILTQMKINRGPLNITQEENIDLITSEDKEILDYSILTIERFINKDFNTYINQVEIERSKSEANNVIKDMSSIINRIYN